MWHVTLCVNLVTWITILLIQTKDIGRQYNILSSLLRYFFEFHPWIRHMKRMNICTKLLWELKTIEPMSVISCIRITRRLLFDWKNTLQKNHILSFANTHQKMATDQLDWLFWYLLKIWSSFINNCLGTKHAVTEIGGVKGEQLHWCLNTCRRIANFSEIQFWKNSVPSAESFPVRNGF